MVAGSVRRHLDTTEVARAVLYGGGAVFFGPECLCMVVQTCTCLTEMV